MKPDRRWLLPLLLMSAVLTMGASGDGCGDIGDGGDGTKRQAGNGKPAANGKPATEKPPSDEPELTSGQENALRSAEDYLDLSGFSKAGLIDQLSSPAGEGYSKADATFAANNVDVDWKAEAVESAKDYLELGGMSESALYDQLTSPAGEQFTPEEAQYAVDKVY